MSAAPDWDDVARFVGEYMARTGGGTAGRDLLREIAEAYVRARVLPDDAIDVVLPMVDSVL